MSLAPAADEAQIPAAVGDIVITSCALAERVAELAGRISRDYHGKEVLVVGILNGSLPFLSDLVRKLTVPVALDFVGVSRYGGGRPSPVPGVRFTQDLQEQASGRHLLLVDILVDTGLSLDFVVRHLRQRSPASISICSLLTRPELLLARLPLRYLGFEVGEEFLIGYGLDFRGYFRELPYIATMDRRWADLDPRVGRMSA